MGKSCLQRAVRQRFEAEKEPHTEDRHSDVSHACRVHNRVATAAAQGAAAAAHGCACGGRPPRHPSRSGGGGAAPGWPPGPAPAPAPGPPSHWGRSNRQDGGHRTHTAVSLLTFAWLHAKTPKDKVGCKAMIKQGSIGLVGRTVVDYGIDKRSSSCRPKKNKNIRTNVTIYMVLLCAALRPPAWRTADKKLRHLTEAPVPGPCQAGRGTPRAGRHRSPPPRRQAGRRLHRALRSVRGVVSQQRGEGAERHA